MDQGYDLAESEVKREAEIPSVLEELMAQIANLEMTVSLLEKKFSPVLRPANETVTEVDEEKVVGHRLGSRTKLAESLVGLKQRVFATNRAINSIIDRGEL